MSARSVPVAVLLSAALVLAVALVLLWASDAGPAGARAAAAPATGSPAEPRGAARSAVGPPAGSAADLAHAPASEVERTASSPIPLSSVEPARAQLRGRVLEHDGRPAADAVVQLQPRDPDGAPTTWEPLEFRGTTTARRLHFARNRVVRADAGGDFAFDGLPKGPYQLRALRAEGYGAEQLDLHLVSAGQAPPVAVELVLPPPSWLEGLLVAGGESDLTGLLVRLRPVLDVVGSQLRLRGLESEPRSVDAEGRFRIAPLAPGNYHLLLTFPLAVRSGRARLEEGGYEGPTLELDVIHVPPGGSGQRFFLNERLPGRVRLVVLMNQAPLPGLELLLVPESPSGAIGSVRVETDVEGQLELSLPTGAWTVRPTLFDDAAPQLPDESPLRPDRVRVSHEGPSSTTLVLPTYSGRLQLADSTGRALARTTVTVYARAGRRLAEGTTDAGGRVEFALPTCTLQIVEASSSSRQREAAVTWTPHGPLESTVVFGPP